MSYQTIVKVASLNSREGNSNETYHRDN